MKQTFSLFLIFPSLSFLAFVFFPLELQINDLGCAAYKVGYSLGWNAAGSLYGGQDNSRDYEDSGENYEGYYADDEYSDEDEDEDEDNDDDDDNR